MNDLNILDDRRTNCKSLIHTTTVGVYLDLIKSVYQNRGGIQGQRAPLKTKTGIRIRRRMIDDLQHGAVLPPIVIGATLDATEIDRVKKCSNNSDLEQFFKSVDPEKISIIDGMQRTTALLEANENSLISSNPVRLEYWLAESVNSLIYRMLVLNTGQVPWDMKRQLQTVYEPILLQLKEKVRDIDVFTIDEKTRRSQPGQFQTSRLVEFFLAFSSKKINVDVKEKVAEDFARMDATESTADPFFLDHFISVATLLAKLDKQFSRFKGDVNTDGFRFKMGRDIFTSAPAGIGFMAAASVFIHGAPGFPRNDDSAERTQRLVNEVEQFISRLGTMDEQDLGEFMELLELNEKLSARSGKVGEFEREFFYKAFTAMFDFSSTLPSMSPCWAAM